ncbi:MAG: cytochrome c biogenesis protein CcsA [Bacteroidia bacterium]
MQYQGEQLIFGKIGNALIVLAFVCALLSCIAYYFSNKNPLDKSWKNIARSAFFVHTLSVIGIFSVLYYLILNHRFEYYYVWEHSSTILPPKYIFACFWEGQEGSFLLWTFWHTMLSMFIIRKGGEWEAPVLMIVSMVQVFLCSMVLGIYFFGYKLGTNPFTLLRDHPDMANLPFIKMPDYLSKIEDGRGLNPLLQNYWMVIHPPTLFLGFASTVIPFAFAMAGLIRGKVTEWIKPVLPWTFFGVMILGTGILMGAAWAYEALSFGGFWAWDPVENASLVPWLTLVGGAHVMMIQKKGNQSLLSCFILVIVTFMLILYSTFLTRSGILGDTSVHAFTDLGMSGQLLVYMAFFSILGIFLLIKNRKLIPKSHSEDTLSSREFWMFIGMLVLVISCLQITFTTSIPVINKLFGTNMAPPPKPVEHYNSWQIPIAVVIALLIGIGQYFKYKKTNGQELRKKILLPIIISIVISSIAAYFLKFERIHFVFLLFASVFAVVANLDYMLLVLKGRIEHAGASLAHAGIGMILLGALISNANSTVISKNVSNMDLGKDFPNNENIMLVKGDTLRMADYYVTWSKKEKEGVNIFYSIDYLKADQSNGTFEKQFTLQPIVQLNKRMGNVAEPATEHFFTKDIYTHITYADLEKEEKVSDADTNYNAPKSFNMSIGDTISTSNSLIVLTGLNKNTDKNKYALSEKDIAVTAQLEIIDVNKKIYHSEPLFIIKNNVVFSEETLVDDLGLRLGFKKIDPETGKFEITVAERKENKREFIIMKAIIFPHINILWMGCVLMIIGTLIAIRKRIALGKLKREA